MRAFLAVALLLASSAAFAGQDGAVQPVAAQGSVMQNRAGRSVVLPSVPFSAVAVQQMGPVEMRQTIHYADGKLRIDGPKGFAATILDLQTETQCLLMANHTYLVLPMDDELFRRYFARPVNDTGAEKLKRERVGDQETTKFGFEGDGALDAGGFYWLTDSGIMVKRAYEEGVYGEARRHLDFLTEVQVGPQDAALFKVPPGYKRTR